MYQVPRSPGRRSGRAPRVVGRPRRRGRWAWSADDATSPGVRRHRIGRRPRSTAWPERLPRPGPVGHARRRPVVQGGTMGNESLLVRATCPSSTGPPSTRSTSSPDVASGPRRRASVTRPAGPTAGPGTRTAGGPWTTSIRRARASTASAGDLRRPARARPPSPSRRSADRPSRGGAHGAPSTSLPPPDRRPADRRSVGSATLRPMTERPTSSADLLERAIAAERGLADLGESIEDEWSYVNDLDAAWAEPARRTSRRAGRRAGASVAESPPSTRRSTRRGRSIDPHRAIDWLSTFPQVVLLALGEPA